MATIVADNIISPLGFTTESNLEAIMSGSTSLYHYDRMEGIPFPFTASLFTGEQKGTLLIEGYTFLESLAIQSIKNALHGISIPLDERVILIISSTKLNIDLLKDDKNEENVISPGIAALKIAQAIGIATIPIVVCNACISGVSAIILGNRLINLGLYDHAIVCGVDVQSPFIISGFQSFKALSEEPCRPFDIERHGLNLGEGVATVVLSRFSADNVSWHIKKGAMRNDAFHVTSPSPQGDGCLRSIQTVIEDGDLDRLALINAHGTATMYNDQMESKAIDRAGFSKIPLNGLKGYYGHTMGAAGILETILTMHSVEKGIIIRTKGFEEIGVSGNVNVVSKNIGTKKSDFIKIISGFGGCNAAVLLSYGKMCETILSVSAIQVVHKLTLRPDMLDIDGVKQDIETDDICILNYLYKNRIGNYPKFYKMDGLARLGFVASELILNQEGQKRFVNNNERRAIVFFNKYGSVHADIEYLKTISDEDNFYPSPSEFVYTLPNIVNGEIAIRNGYSGETCFYILPEKDEQKMNEILQTSFYDNKVDSILTGWIEYKSDNDFEAELFIIKK